MHSELLTLTLGDLGVLPTLTKLHTIKSASSILGIQYRQLLDAVNNKTIPYYQVHKSRRMLKLEEVLSIMKQDVEGGVAND